MKDHYRTKHQILLYFYIRRDLQETTKSREGKNKQTNVGKVKYINE